MNRIKPDASRPIVLKLSAAELEKLVDGLVSSVDSETYLKVCPPDSSPAGVLSRWRECRSEFMEKSMKAGCTERSARSLLKMIDGDAALLKRLLPLLPKEAA